MTRNKDQCFMDTLMEQNKIVKIFNRKELEDVSRCRKYKKVYYLSDIKLMLMEKRLT